jgi:hypothetical protein
MVRVAISPRRFNARKIDCASSTFSGECVEYVVSKLMR